MEGQLIANQPIVFNIQYTPYRLPKNATEKDIAKHRSDRAFYDLSGGENLLKYIATESKRAGKITAIDYFQKSTGIFNKNGMISQEELEQMKVRA